MTQPILPSQVAYPEKAVVRTALQVFVGLAAIAPFLVTDLGLNTTGGLIAGALGVAAALTRIMAIPAVDRMLAGVGLGAEPKE